MKNISIEQLAKRAYAAVSAGGLSLVKVDVGYILLGHSEVSVREMYQLKERPVTKTCPVAGNLEVLMDVALIPNKKILEWIEIIQQQTIIHVVNKINPNSKLLAKISPWVYEQVTLSDNIAVFLNGGECINKMVAQAYTKNNLLVASSANLAGMGNSYHFMNVPASWEKKLDFYVDQGDCKYQNEAKSGATIINLVDFEIQRIGANAELIINSFNEFADAQGLPKLVC